MKKLELYPCAKCGHSFSHLVPVYEEDIGVCEECAGKLEAQADAYADSVLEEQYA